MKPWTTARLRAAVLSRISADGNMEIRVQQRTIVALVHDTGCVRLAHSMIDNPLADGGAVSVEAAVLECLVQVAEREVGRYQPPAPRPADPKARSKALRAARNRRHREKLKRQAAAAARAMLAATRDLPTPAEASRQLREETASR